MSTLTIVIIGSVILLGLLVGLAGCGTPATDATTRNHSRRPAGLPAHSMTKDATPAPPRSDPQPPAAGHTSLRSPQDNVGAEMVDQHPASVSSTAGTLP